MRIHNITHDDMLNGSGLRVALWVAGCNHHCEQCQNPLTWDPNGGINFTEWEENEFYEWLSKSWTKGATFTGGDPLHPANRKKVFSMMEEINKSFPGKDIWVYTGYKVDIANGTLTIKGPDGTFEVPELGNADIVIDGRFEYKTRQKDIDTGKTVLWRGSSNQKIIDIKASLAEGRIVTIPDDKVDEYHVLSRPACGCGCCE